MRGKGEELPLSQFIFVSSSSTSKRCGYNLCFKSEVSVTPCNLHGTDTSALL